MLTKGQIERIAADCETARKNKEKSGLCIDDAVEKALARCAPALLSSLREALEMLKDLQAAVLELSGCDPSLPSYESSLEARAERMLRTAGYLESPIDSVAQKARLPGGDVPSDAISDSAAQGDGKEEA